MSGLFDQFVRHYSEISKNNQFRMKFEESWHGIDRDDEVRAIKDYLMKAGVGVSYLNSKVAPYLYKWPFTVKFASVFCHQKPRVSRTILNQNINPSIKNQCELGDLFVLFILLKNGIDLQYASGALFQAKRQNKMDNDTQRFLYDYDMDFEVPKFLEKRPGSPGISRRIPSYSEGRANAFRYLILNPRRKLDKVFARRTPWTNGYCFCWSTFMDGLLSGADGIQIYPGSSEPSSWDIIAEDLMHMVVKIPSNKPPRGNDVATQVATQFFNNFSHLKNFRIEGGDETLGIPTLMVIANSPVEYFEAPPVD